MSSTAVVKTDQPRTLVVRGWVDSMMPELKKALPRHVKAEQFARVALTAIQSNPKLLAASQASIALSLLRSASLGLVPDGLMGHAWLVPYWNSKAKTMEAQFQIGYKGLIDLAYRTDKVAGVHADVVRSNDVFDYWTDEHGPHLKHKPAFGNRGDVIGAYCIVRVKDGDPIISALDRATIERDHREHSKGYKPDDPDCIWLKHEAAMFLKTAIRAAFKTAPQSKELAEALALDERTDLGIEAPAAGTVISGGVEDVIDAEETDPMTELQGAVTGTDNAPERKAKDRKAPETAKDEF